jgi:glycosyltransferase involved in cell wall biosynthesis
MRILMVTDVYFPRINGVSTSIQTFRNELQKLGHDVWLIAPSYDAPYADDDRIIRIESRGIPIDPEDRMMKFNKILLRLTSLRHLDFEVVHIHTPFVAHYGGKKIAKALGVPCVITYHTLFEEYFHHYIPWLPKKFLGFIARRFSVSQCNEVDGVISPSSTILELLKQYGVSVKMTTLPTGIDSSAFKTGNGERFREVYSIPTDKKLLLNVSRIAFEKNISAIIEAYAELRQTRDDLHLVIAGEGPAKNHYIAMAAKLRLTDDISFVGYLDRSTQLIDCYHAADLFVFASKTETQGLVLLEAMATGTPVVSVAEMGTLNVLKENFGVKITDGSPKDFAAKIAQVIDDPNLYEHLEKTAVAYAAEWDSLYLAKKLLDYYSEILTNHDISNSLPIKSI